MNILRDDLFNINKKVKGPQTGIRGMEVKSVGYDSFGLTDIQVDILRSQMYGSGMGAYTQLWVIHKCVTMTAEVTADMITETVSLVNQNNEAVNNPVWDKLRGMPNRFETFFELLELGVIYIQLDGNIYFLNPGVGLKPDFFVLKSQDICPEWVGTGIDKDIVYKDRFTKLTYPSDQITHVKYPNPGRERIKGESRLVASKPDIGFARLIDIYKNALYENQGTPSGLYTTDMALGETQRNKMLREIRESEGAANAGRSKLLESGITYNKIAIPPTDIKMIESENMNAANLASALGVPIEMLGALGQDSKTYSNYEQAPKDYMQRTIIPTANRILRQLTKDYFFDAGLKLKINKALIPALQPKVDDLAKAYWLTINQRRAMQGLQPSEELDANKLLIPSNLVPLDMLNLQDGGNL